MVSYSHLRHVTYGYSDEETRERMDKICTALLANAATIAESEINAGGMGNVTDKAKVIRDHIRVARSTYYTGSTLDVVYSPKGVIAALIGSSQTAANVVNIVLSCISGGNKLYLVPHPRMLSCAKAIVNCIEVLLPPGCIVLETETTEALVAEVMNSKDHDFLINTGLSVSLNSVTDSFEDSEANTCVIVDGTAHLKTTISNVVSSKTFDSGSYPSTEGVIIAIGKDIAQAMIEESNSRNDIHIINEKMSPRLNSYLRCADSGLINHESIGKTANEISTALSLAAPVTTRLLLVPCEATDLKRPELRLKKSPVVALVTVDSLAEACSLTKEICANECATVYPVVLATNIHTKPNLPAEVAKLTQASQVFVNLPILAASSLIHGIEGSVNRSTAFDYGVVQQKCSIVKMDASKILKLAKQRGAYPNIHAPLSTDEFISQASKRFALETLICNVESIVRNGSSESLLKSFSSSVGHLSGNTGIDSLVRDCTRPADCVAAMKQGDGAALTLIKKAARLINRCPVELYCLHFSTFLHSVEFKELEGFKDKEALIAFVESHANAIGLMSPIGILDSKKLKKKGLPSFGDRTSVPEVSV